MSRIAVIGIAGNSVFLPVSEFHVGGETVEASSVHFEPGGKGFNQAVAAARSGGVVSFFAAVGKNDGDGIGDFLRREGIDAVLVEKEGASAFAAIVTDRHGSNRVTVHQGVQLAACDVALFERQIAAADLLLLSNEVAEEVNIAAIRVAKAHGVPVILNPAPARESDPYILENVDLFTPNEHETLGLDGKKNVLVTLGKRGCLLRGEDRIIPAVRAGTVLDTTGAGDTFNGVLAALVAAGTPLSAAARAANRVCAVGVTRRYAVSSIPTGEEIAELIKKEEKGE